MPPQWQPAREPVAAEAWAVFLRPVAADVRRDARALSQQTVERLLVDTPEAFSGPTLFEQVAANAQAAFLAVAESIESGSDPTMLEVPAGILAGARSRAQTGFPLTQLLRGHRLIHESLADWMAEAISRRDGPAELRAVALRLCSSWLFAAVDVLSTRYAEVYENEREQWLRGAAALRTETIQAILAEAELDPPTASRRLGYELNRYHVGVIAWLPSSRSEHPGGHDMLQADIQRFAAGVGADAWLVEPIGLRAMMAWISRAAPFEDSLIAAASTGHSQTALAVGEPAGGLDGFRRSHLDASHARRVAELLGRGPRVTRYVQVELLAIATLDPGRTRDFVQRALGALAGDDDAHRRLAATLGIYLQENCSRSRAARRLGLHENTITYRIRQAQEILGRPVEGDGLRLEAALALLPAVQRRAPPAN